MTLAGIDVSAYQGDFPWQDYKGKIGFAGVKVTEGLKVTDSQAARNVAGAHSIGIPVIAYHFLHAGLPAADQVEHFLEWGAKAKLKERVDLLALDAEDGGLDGEDPSQMNVTCAAAHAQLDRHFPNYHPVLYTEQSMAPHLTSMAMCPLWVADLSAPLVTKAGPWSLVSFWQTGQRGVDTDVFNGSAADLAKLAFSK